jgi:hypothetical protein
MVGSRVRVTGVNAAGRVTKDAVPVGEGEGGISTVEVKEGSSMMV